MAVYFQIQSYILSITEISQKLRVTITPN